MILNFLVVSSQRCLGLLVFERGLVRVRRVFFLRAGAFDCGAGLFLDLGLPVFKQLHAVVQIGELALARLFKFLKIGLDA